MVMMVSSTDYVIGESHGFHDGAISVLKTDGSVYFAEHSERRSGIKHDPDQYLHGCFVGPLGHARSAFYEKPRIRQVRQWIAGEKVRPKAYGYDAYIGHHWAHAAASYYTRPWPVIEPVCVVIDAIGEFDTASIWYKKKKVWSMKYPTSLGLFFSAVTQSIGLQPNRDEHLTMALAATQQPYDKQLTKYMSELVTTNLHKGLPEEDITFGRSRGLMAATAQQVLETEILKIMAIARKYSAHLCYGGGVALNCVANSKVHELFDDTWIFPNPGDAGAAFGAAAAYLDKHIPMMHNFWGMNIIGEPNPKEIAKHILKHGIAGIANGRGEYGPRALGNRSLVCDPRGEVPQKVYTIKQRAPYSPLAPAILVEHFDEYFTGPQSAYMSYVCKTKNSDHMPMISHIDGSARVQVVKPDSPSILRKVLEEWYNLTACPILINTSLNPKGNPVVNIRKAADSFGEKVGIKIY